MRQGKINAPIMAFHTVYREPSKTMISGREAQHETKNINGVAIDKHIPTEAMQKLMSMTHLFEMRSSCQGDSPRHLTFAIFRPKNQDEKFVKRLVSILNGMSLKASYDRGLGGLYRVCVSDYLWYSPENEGKFRQWWEALPIKLRIAFKKASQS